MKNVSLIVALTGLALLLTACPTMNLPNDQKQDSTKEFQISVFPKELNLEANSSVGITVKLQDSGQVHPAILVYVDNLPAGVQAQPVTIPANADQTQLELRTSKSYKAYSASFATVSAATSFAKSETHLQLLRAPIDVWNDNSNIRASFVNQTSTNANLTDYQAQIGYANFKGSLCQIMSSDRHRNIEICLTAPYEQGRQYKLVDAIHFGTPGTALLTYFEPAVDSAQSTTNSAGTFWDSTNGILTLQHSSSTLLEFQVQAATMAPAKDFEHNNAFGNFTLELSGHIEDISNF
jgi:hypothetical protein